MRRFVGSLVLLAAAVGMASCSGDPLGPQRDNAVKIVANPQSVFVTRGGNTTALVQVVDSLGNALEVTGFSATATSNSISVSRDSLYQPVYGASGDTLPNPNPTVVRLVITGNAIATSSIVVQARGITDTLPVRVTPSADAADLTVDAQASALGQPLTITAPSGSRFTSATEVTFTSGPGSLVQSFSPDSTQVTVIPGPGSSGHITATHVGAIYNPTFTTFTVTSVNDTVSVPDVSTFPSSLSSTAPAANAPVILTGNTGYTFLTNAAVSVGGADALVTDVSSDGTMVTFLPKPGGSGEVSVANTGIFGFPLEDALPTGQTITAVGALTPMAGTDAFATAPTLNAPDLVGGRIALWDGAPYGFTGSEGDFGGDSRLYKLVVDSAGTYTFSLPSISDGADLGVYFYDATQTATSDLVDASGGGASDAESGDIDLEAGTYYISIVYFQYGASPTPAALYGLTIERAQ